MDDPTSTPPKAPETPPEPLPKTPPAPEAPPKAVAPEGPKAPPPAAKIVLEGTKTERELSLEKDLKARETRLAELEDENRTLKAPPSAPAAPRQAKAKKSWLEGNTFFDQE